MILGTYDPTYGELREDEFLLKIKESEDRILKGGKWVTLPFKKGFLTKLTKKGELPVKFEDGGKSYIDRTPLPTYVFRETYRSGWALKSWRIGQSQEWAVMKHPEGFTVEIYLDNFLELALNEALDQGNLVGEYRWEANRLIKKC